MIKRFENPNDFNVKDGEEWSSLFLWCVGLLGGVIIIFCSLILSALFIGAVLGYNPTPSTTDTKTLEVVEYPEATIAPTKTPSPHLLVTKTPLLAGSEGEDTHLCVFGCQCTEAVFKERIRKYSDWVSVENSYIQHPAVVYFDERFWGDFKSTTYDISIFGISAMTAEDIFKDFECLNEITVKLPYKEELYITKISRADSARVFEGLSEFDLQSDELFISVFFCFFGDKYVTVEANQSVFPSLPKLEKICDN